ncbi:MAG TPA: hypothetical protein DCL35_02570 [Candidatus Omnitrophica bacterium]|nr:hypothetical protein [Candidatus Omnitrophota bacterium]
MRNVELLNKSRAFLEKHKNTAFVYREHFRNKRTAPQKGSKVLLFKNFLYRPGKEEQATFSQSALYLASSLKNNGFQYVFSESRISTENNSFITAFDSLQRILSLHPDINIICIPLYEDFFLKAKELVDFLRRETNAFIGVGGTMPTLNPEHVFAHLPGVNFLLRGSGEEALASIARILKDKNTTSELDLNTIQELSRLTGFIFRSNGYFIAAAPDQVNHIEDFDRSGIDLSLLGKEDVSDGLILYTARGCRNGCFFCTTFGHGTFRGKSAGELARICDDYLSRLPELFEGKVPAESCKISFYDDDFLADPQRALKFFDYLKTTPLKIKFFQAGIRSFSNNEVLSRIDNTLFDSRNGHVYIGTENFCDRELARLGKGYGFKQAQEVIAALSARQIKQYHHLILSNHLTGPRDMAENLFKITALQYRYKPYFNVLAPIIPYLVSLYPSISYRIAKKTKRLKYLNIPKTLSLKEHRRYDYPLVKNDIPTNSLTRRLVPVVERAFRSEKDYAKILDGFLLGLSLLTKEHRGQNKIISGIAAEYSGYPELIKKDTGTQLKNHRNNIQLMLTRRCQLRCRYCPVIKKETSMPVNVLFASVDLLFTSSKKDLRIDFTGGEPLLEFGLVKKTVAYAKKTAEKKGKTVSFYMVTNALALDEAKADFLASERFFLELSVDGSERIHNHYKIPGRQKFNPYRLTTRNIKMVFAKNIRHCAIMVVAPKIAGHLYKNFTHLIELGFRDIGINYALGADWTSASRSIFFKQLDRIRSAYFSCPQACRVRLNNLGSRLEPAILNTEIMADTDGSLHLLTDWLFEKDGGRAAPRLSNVRVAGDFDDFYFSNAAILHRLLRYNTPRVKNIILNNIRMGYETGAYFKGAFTRQASPI